MRIRSFRGGLGTRKEPNLINEEQAVVYTNVDDTKASLSPVKNALAGAAQQIDDEFFDARNQWEAFSVRQDVEEFQKRMYATDRVTQAVSIDDSGNRTQMGLVGPDAQIVTPFAEAMNLPDNTLTWHGTPAASVTGNNDAWPSAYEDTLVATGGLVGYRLNTSPTAIGLGPVGDRLFFICLRDTLATMSNGLLIKNAAGTQNYEVIRTNTTNLDLTGLINDTATANPDSPEFVLSFPGLPRDAASKLFILAWRLTDNTWIRVAAGGTVGLGQAPGTNDSLVAARVNNDSMVNISGSDVLPYTIYGSDINNHFTKLVTRTRYVMTYYNATKGVESAPSPVTDLKPTDDQVQFLAENIDDSFWYNSSQLSFNGTLLTLPVPTDTQITAKRIYRVGDGSSVFTLVAEVSRTTTTYYDFAQFAEIETSETLPEVSGNAPPAGIAFFTEYKGMMFGAKDNVLRFTPIGRVEEWPEIYSIVYKSDITSISVVVNGLIVCTRTETHLVTGSQPTALSSKPTREDLGCVDHYSMQSFRGQALWLSEDGLCATTGGNVELITREDLGTLDLTVVDSVVHDENYYLLTAVSGVNNVLAYNFGLNGIYKNFSVSTARLHNARNVLYGWDSGNLQNLFAGPDDLIYTYRSPEFDEGAIDMIKRYDEVYFWLNGTITAKILVDGVQVSEETHENVVRDTVSMKVPINNQTGYTIQMEFSGTGTIRSLFIPAEIQSNVG